MTEGSSTASPRSTRGWLARGGSLGFVGAAGSAVLGFALTIMLTRMLGSQGAGVVMQATGVFALVVALSKVGMDSTVIYLLPRLVPSEPGEVRRTLTFMSLVAVSVSTAAALVLIALAPLVWAAQGQTLVAVIRAVAWFLPAQALLLVATAALRALGGMREYVLVQNLALPLLRPPAVALAVLATSSLVIVGLAWAAPLVLVLAVALLLLSRKLRAWPSDPPGRLLPQGRRTREILAFATPRTLAAGLEQAIVWLDVLLVGTLLGDGAAGIYGGASRFIQAGMLVDSALRIVVSPKLSALVKERRLEELRDLHATATTWLVLFASPIYVLMAVYSPTLMTVLGEGFGQGAPVVVVLSVGACTTFLAGNIHTLLIMSGHSGWAAWNKVVVLVLNVVGNLVLVPWAGIVGAAASWALCMVVDAVLASVQVRHLLGVRLGFAQYLVPLGVVLVSVGVPAALVLTWWGQSLWALAISCVLSLLCFGAACIVWRGPLKLQGILDKRS
ncbi:oligosaccharide flippase family protein [Schaalia sp. 19OD2882]|uniref:oligosaccharide flippase family protein n=1 Tax=Schaalia sp. 19OD2882 TaxID=2794089 RepID=UPI001C1EB666|nr:oligosaccharide flippase family protein [Schaalia sp. 19OD2882]QWW19171.1 oligosaccharide flippase family protein [Schaalia sp. 19OD2882]